MTLNATISAGGEEYLQMRAYKEKNLQNKYRNASSLYCIWYFACRRPSYVVVLFSCYLKFVFAFLCAWSYSFPVFHRCPLERVQSLVALGLDDDLTEANQRAAELSEAVWSSGVPLGP